MTSSPDPQALERRRPQSSQTVSVNISDGSQNGPRRFQLEVSECVETKTITTTTRLTRKFPQIFVRDPPSLDALDTKEYPLARTRTPPELLDFTYRLPLEDPESDAGHLLGQPTARSSRHLRRSGRSSQKSSPDVGTGSSAAQGKKTLTAQTFPDLPNPDPREADTISLDHASRRSVDSPSEGCARRTRHPRSRRSGSPSSSATATVAPSRSSSRLTRSSSGAKGVSDKLRRSITHSNAGAASTDHASSSASRARRGEIARAPRSVSHFLATPDTSEISGATLEHSCRHHSQQLAGSRDSPPEPRLSQSLTAFSNISSPSESDGPLPFGNNVATPPITDSDAHANPFGDAHDSPQQPIRALHHTRPTIDVIAAQDASLPSPRLSPTLAAAQTQNSLGEVREIQDASQDESQVEGFDRFGWTDDPWAADDGTHKEMRPLGAHYSANLGAVLPYHLNEGSRPAAMDTQLLLEAFDSMKPEMKRFMMYQFLRRCSRPTLRFVANTVNPTLKCDFLSQLPLELGYHVLSYLDHRDLCRSAQVSKHWRNIVDRNETGWKELFDRDGYVLPVDELNKAILQGWGWQDPVGQMDYERDLSMHSRLTSSERDLTRILRHDIAPKGRSKRKRGLNTYTALERSKRRAGLAGEATAIRDDRALVEVRQHKSEGPLSAANAAASAVPNPQQGLDSLRQLHLFKSLYRRHHIIRYSWTSGKVKPSHVAFTAHPRHVITCLQFDEDKIITGSDDTLIHIYDTKTGKLRKKLEGHEGGVWALQYVGNTLVSGSTDRSVRVWDIERGLCQQVFYGHTSTVRCLQILMPTKTGNDAQGNAIMEPDRPLIITGSRDSQLRVWRLPEVGSRRYIQTGPPAHESDCPYFVRVLTGHTHSVRAISAHGNTLVSGSYDSSVRVWSIDTGESRHVLHGHAQKVYSVVLDHERNRCISGSMDSLVKIWDLTSGECLHTLEGHSLLVGLLDLQNDRLVSAAADSTLRIWDPESGRCRSTLLAHTGAITCFQHDGQKVISGSEKSVKMWNVRTGECVQDLLTDLSGVWQVKFDERRCVAAVQREGLTYIEILDFGAFRDGRPPGELGRRILLNEPEARGNVEEEI